MSAAALLPVHVVVLAAGRGSRLGPHGEERPKWLLPVGGRTLADRHLEGIAAAGDAVASVQVVTGHAGEAIQEAHPGIATIPVAEWAERNNWWSLLRALRELPAGEPVAVLNSDLLVAPDQVAAFLHAFASGQDDAALAVDHARTLTDESMKVTRAPHGGLERIGKVDVERPVGEYIGLLAARGDALQALRDELEQVVHDPGGANEWYEHSVGRIAAAGVRWALWPVLDPAWVEIDDLDDLADAEALAPAAVGS